MTIYLPAGEKHGKTCNYPNYLALLRSFDCRFIAALRDRTKVILYEANYAWC